MRLVKDVFFGFSMFAAVLFGLFLFRSIPQMLRQQQTGHGAADMSVPSFVAGVCFIVLSVILLKLRP